MEPNEKNKVAKRYEQTYNDLLDKLPIWKRIAIREDIKLHKSSGLLDEFVMDVIKTAEENIITLSE